MLTQEELKIIALFQSDLFKEYNIREIMRKISKKSYNWTFNVVKKLERMNLIISEKRGKAWVCSLNLNTCLAIAYLSFLAEFRANLRLPKKIKNNITIIISSIPLAYFSFIVTGSYAKGKATKHSDLDIVIIVEDKINSKEILTILKNKSEFMTPTVHPYVFTKSEFIKMLLSKEENYGKFIYRNNLIFFGAQNYYLILKGAIKNGFRGC